MYSYLLQRCYVHLDDESLRITFGSFFRLIPKRIFLFVSLNGPRGSVLPVCTDVCHPIN